MAANVYQIFYSEKTRRENDPGFLPLDNSSNERPDWREYWPIRNYLLRNELDPDGLYGFLSPKFRQKTGLDAVEVKQFVAQCDADVIHFSPFFDQSAFFVNVFEQASTQHPGIFAIFKAVFEQLDKSVDIGNLVMDSSSTVFCNYFVAKPKFWQEWLALTESVFDMAEKSRTPIADDLNRITTHDGIGAPNKVFVIERIVSFMLATQQWNVKAYNPMSLPFANSPIAGYGPELCILDALKGAYARTRYPEYLQTFHQIRSTVYNHIQQSAPSGG